MYILLFAFYLLPHPLFYIINKKVSKRKRTASQAKRKPRKFIEGFAVLYLIRIMFALERVAMQSQEKAQLL